MKISHGRKRSPKLHRGLARLPLAAAIHLVCIAPALAHAEDAAPQAGTAPTTQPDDKSNTQLGEVTVTAQKRVENLQVVPISLDVLSNQKLAEMNVSDFNDWVKLLPSVSTSSSQGAYSPGFGQFSMRGVESGSNGNHSGPWPSVGVYLDEEPITTIVGAIDPHIYDIARIEALAGPQGTLYGASSQSGTIRIITNKPDPTAFSASVSAEVNAIDHGGEGFVTEGYINLPLSQSMALRVVGWAKQDAGYIDNVPGTRTYPTSGITISNADGNGGTGAARNNYNFTDTRGARAALKIDLNDDWSITPTVISQTAHGGGINAYDPAVGDLKVTHFFPENFEDRWTQSALTVQGKIGNFDLVYTVSHLDRSDHYDQDYSDYSFWYDTLYGYGAYITDKNGNLIDPSQHIHAQDKYKKTSNELRISSPKDNRFRFTAGLFAQRQTHDILQDYLIDGLSPDLSVTGWPNTIWLTRQLRTDTDSAIFGEMSYDFTDKLTGSLGARFFHTEDSLKGFFGYAAGYSSSQGEATCFSAEQYKGAPCTDVDKETKDTDHIGRANLTYKLDDDKMIYGTWSEGFRPGGINRRGTLPPYQPDFLTNWEFGWKTEWLDHHLRWNGAVFQENWKDFQFAVVGANGLTEIRNANQARIRGFESNWIWAATYNLSLSAGFSYYNAELTENYCGTLDDNDKPITDCAEPLAPKGSQLPITPKVKGDVTARYSFDLVGNEAYVQAAAFFTGRRRSDLRTLEGGILGDLPGYGTVDLSTGMKKDKWSFDFYMKNVFDNRGTIANYAECQATVCGAQTYLIPTQPRTIGMRVTRDFD